MKQLRRLGRALAWLAILALLGHEALLAAPRPAARADGVLGPLVICTTDGAKAVPADDGTGGAAPCDHCPACVPLAPIALAAIGGDPVAISFPLPVVQRPPRNGASPLAVHLIHGAIHSRGPPRHAA
jgi:hypothetical protein